MKFNDCGDLGTYKFGLKTYISKSASESKSKLRMIVWMVVRGVFKERSSGSTFRSFIANEAFKSSLDTFK